MGRPAKDYWNWNEITIPYDGDWKKSTDASEFLYSNTPSESQYEIRATTEYEQPRRRGDYKKVIAHHYYIKDTKLATFFKLKFSSGH